MHDDRYERFASALGERGATVDRSDPSGAAEQLAAAVDPPAVGVPLPFEELSVPETVETDPTPADLERASTGVTPAAYGVASTGTLGLESTSDGVEPVSLYPETHVAVLHESDLLADLSSGFERLRDQFANGQRSVVFATGRSSTADMGALVHGVHGPQDVHVLVLEGESDE